MKLSVGPIPYFWDKEHVINFYKHVEDLPIDIVYLGEIVCAKRRQLDLEDWLDIAERLTATGMEVVLSTLTLIQAESEQAILKNICNNGKYSVEANDMSAVNLMAEKTAFVIGANINVYNNHTLSFLHELGARRWVYPIELGHGSMRELQAQRPAGLETEIIAFGRVSLAFSARCFSARAHNRGKDDCCFVCAEYENGLVLETQDDKPFLMINGIQIQSASAQNLINHIEELRDLNTNILRIIPQAHGFEETVRVFRQLLDCEIQADAATEILEKNQGYGCCNGYWYGQAGMNSL